VATKWLTWASLLFSAPQGLAIGTKVAKILKVNLKNILIFSEETGEWLGHRGPWPVVVASYTFCSVFHCAARRTT
jgi:hypothetical protein